MSNDDDEDDDEDTRIWSPRRPSLNTSWGTTLVGWLANAGLSFFFFTLLFTLAEQCNFYPNSLRRTPCSTTPPTKP